jgi:hypothetical protein
MHASGAAVMATSLAPVPMNLQPAVEHCPAYVGRRRKDRHNGIKLMKRRNNQGWVRQ